VTAMPGGVGEGAVTIAVEVVLAVGRATLVATNRDTSLPHGPGGFSRRGTPWCGKLEPPPVRDDWPLDELRRGVHHYPLTHRGVCGTLVAQDAGLAARGGCLRAAAAVSGGPKPFATVPATASSPAGSTACASDRACACSEGCGGLMNSKTTGFIATVAAGLALIGCGPSQPSTTRTVTYSGATLTAGAARLTIPHLSLNQEVTVTLREAVPRHSGRVKRIEIEPHGSLHGVPEIPAYLSVKVDDSNPRVVMHKGDDDSLCSTEVDDRNHHTFKTTLYALDDIEVEVQPGLPCTTACGTGQVCVDGVCKEHNDEATTCDTVCPTFFECDDGTCKYHDEFEAEHHGTPGTCSPTCVTGLTCVQGYCEAPSRSAGRCTAPNPDSCLGPPISASRRGDDLCTNFLSDPRNCGGCSPQAWDQFPDPRGTRCTEGTPCIDGICVPCPPYEPNIHCGRCSTLTVQNDDKNCGVCGRQCSNSFCVNGECDCRMLNGTLCPTATGAVCTSLGSDSRNCGTCGNVCPAGQVCKDSVCT
jgi:hypothetical protein